MDFLRDRRPKLFERGVLPGYLLEIRSDAKEIAQ